MTASVILATFAIRPPVYLRDGRPISRLSDAETIVRHHALSHCSLRAAALLRQIESTHSAEEAQAIGLEFRAWAAHEGLLLKRPCGTRSPPAATSSIRAKQAPV